MKGLLSGREAALIKKDLREIWSEKDIRTSMIFIPVFAAVILPFAFLLLAVLSPEKNTSVEFAAMKSLLPQRLAHYDVRQTVFYLAMEMVIPMLFLLIPVLVGSMVSAVLFAGEKERGTMETLLFAPVSVKRLGQVKWVSSAAFSVMITLLSFVLLTVIGAVGDIILSIRFFLNLAWMIEVFILAPLLSIMAVLLTALYSLRLKKQREAYQISLALTFPIVIFYLLPFTGVYRISVPMLLLFALLILILDIILVKAFEKRFTALKLLI